MYKRSNTQKNFLSAPLVLSAMLVLSSTAAVAADPNTANTGDKDLTMKEHVIKWMLNDKKFVEQAAMSNLAEIELSRLALEKTQNPEVVSFAKLMVQDHTMATAKLSDIARAQNIAVPAELDRDHRDKLEELRGLSNAQFDAKYIDTMVKDHDKAVSLFTAASDDDKLNPQLRQFAQQTLPALKLHQKHVNTVANQPSAARQ